MQNKIRKRHPNVCRKCVNEAFNRHGHLYSSDCVYHYYPRICPMCGQTKNIVIGLRFSGRLKMLIAGRRKNV